MALAQVVGTPRVTESFTATLTPSASNRQLEQKRLAITGLRERIPCVSSLPHTHMGWVVEGGDAVGVGKVVIIPLELYSTSSEVKVEKLAI